MDQGATGAAVEAVREVPLFAPLTEEQSDWFFRDGTPVTLNGGELLFAAVDTVDCFYVLVDGQLQLTSRVDGRETDLTVREGRDAPMLIGTPKLMQVLALQPSRLLRIGMDHYLRNVVASSPASHVLVSSLVWRIQTTEALLRQREKLAALGKLSAGLAHELNNPASAMGRAAQSLRESIQVLSDLAWKFNHLCLSREQLQAMSDFQREALAHSSGAAQADLLAQSDLEDELAAWLDRHGVHSGWKIAPTLVRAGLDTAWLERLVSAVDDELLADVVAWVEGALTVTGLLDEVEQSAARVSELVGALKVYSYMDQAPRKEVDVHEGLESTLVILGHKLKQGVQVIREYDPDLPPIYAYGSELNQVWTNLIDNAIDAMGGQGRIWLRTAREGDHVVVEIADDGPGIPPELQSHVFEPFFTTKEVGHGSGLGLDISYRIVVQRHRGDVRVYSRPGDTRFRVRLPISPPDRAAVG